MQRFALAGAVVLSAAVTGLSAVGPAEKARLAEAASVVQHVRSSIPAESWAKARCVGVFPNVKRATFGISGGESGAGVLSCRAGDRWSAPAFMQFTKGTARFPIGADAFDVVLLVMNERGVQKLLQGKLVLGADVSIGVPPIEGREPAGAAPPPGDALSYAYAAGRLTSLDASGAILWPDAAANVDVYGRGASPRTVLASREISAPTEAHEFLRALNEASAASAPGRGSIARAAAAPADQPRGTSGVAQTAPAATTDDLRARVVDIEQMLDRLLADTTPAPVSAGATAPSSTVTVERSRLLQMRAQLEALLAALSRR